MASHVDRSGFVVFIDFRGFSVYKDGSLVCEFVVQSRASNRGRLLFVCNFLCDFASCSCGVITPSFSVICNL